MAELEIKNRDQDGAFVLQSTPIPGDRWRAEFRSAPASGAIAFYNPPPLGLASFIEELQTNWRGWDGERTWESLEGDVRVGATHDSGGHVQLSVRLAPIRDRPRQQLEWQLVAAIWIAAGEDLRDLARRAREFEREAVVDGEVPRDADGGDDPWDFKDAWILQAIADSSRPRTLAAVIGSADAINVDIPSRDILVRTINRLLAAGLVESKDGKLRPTRSGRGLVRRVSRGKSLREVPPVLLDVLRSEVPPPVNPHGWRLSEADWQAAYDRYYPPEKRPAR